MSPRGLKPVTWGLMSRTGVPAIASRPRTCTVRPSTPSNSHAVTPSTGFDLVFADEMEEEDHVDVGEVAEPRQRVLAEPIVENDVRFDVAPVVIDRLGSPTDDRADRSQRDVVTHGRTLAREPLRENTARPSAT